MTSPTPPLAQPVVLTDAQIEEGRRETFSTDNPYCPCDSKTMRKAVRWAERALAALVQPPEAPADDQRIQRLKRALERVVECDWAYMGHDADTSNPDSLYSRIREGRAILKELQ